MDSANKTYWSEEQTKLLLNCRLKYEEHFKSGKKKKAVLWGLILQDIKAVDNEFRFSKKEITRKFLNLIITYKRIKKRHSERGRDATCWEYFDLIDKVYGTKKHEIDSTLESLMHSFYTGEPSTSSEIQPIYISDESTHEAQDESYQSSVLRKNNHPVNNRAKKRKSGNNEILQFLKDEAVKNEIRHNEMLQIEKERIQLDRERVQELRDIKCLLQKLI